MSLKIHSDPLVAKVFDQYPRQVRDKMANLRRLILDTADEMEEVSELEETLKWGEPSYITKKGTTIRIDWKKKNPRHYAMYFQCTSLMVPSIRMAYGDNFEYEGNRAIVFDLDESLPEVELKNCIKAGMLYHHIKHLPMLGL